MTVNRDILKRFIIPPLLFIISLGLFSIITHEIVYEQEDWFDTKVFTFIKTYSSAFVISFFKFLTFFGSSTFLFPAYVIMVITLVYIGRRADAIHVSILGITSTVIIYTSKLFFARPRPDLPLFDKLDSFSFPSGHSMGSFVFVCILIRELWECAIAIYWKWIISFCLLATTFAIGISRIVLRYHYASDVVGGFCLGLAYVLFYFRMQKLVRKVR
ncbi:phosphatase PAP2 family protein [Emticicia sp. C21]|uniref:phosphatase PAP2 family protein n=1 Tax=Emticicia sp. C21 TaxID=2302915 RepID=UPI000E34B344|nr:phosphatase PAP2 family protein [Emticicia sp. C21]RFS17741.1 PAP2 family protein [Emticicia sp. C21]